MVAHLKDNPDGIDQKINRIILLFEKKLSFSDFHLYGRVYPLDIDKRKNIPCVYTSNGDYKEILYNDDHSGSMFFHVHSTRNISSKFIIANVDIIFQVDLSKIYPTESNRGDEKFNLLTADILDVENDFNLGEEFYTGEEALENFQTNLKNYHPYYFVRYSGTIKYKINC